MSSEVDCTYTRLMIDGMIRKSRRKINNVPGVSPEQLRRWWRIDHGLLPEEEEGSYHGTNAVERVMELQRGMADEIQAVADDYFHAPIFELDEFKLS